jgi:hypothetical protein
MHLAVKLQLNMYVKSVAIRLHHTSQLDLLSSLFQMVATEYRTTHELFKYQDSSLIMIETFLELGVNPNQRSQPLRHGNVTIWQMVISDAVTRPGIFKLFLRYGTDPFVSQLNSHNLYRGRDDLREFLEATGKRREERQLGMMMRKAQEARRLPNGLGFAINNSLARRTEAVHDLRYDVVEQCAVMVSLS